MTTPIRLTFTEALADLNQLVAEKGADYIYVQPPDSTSCAYFHGSEAGCIVGHVLARRGVTFDDLNRANEERPLNGVGVRMLIDEHVLEVDEPTADLLEYAQETQDQGLTWGTAVSGAVELVIAHHPGSAQCVFEGENDGQ